MKNRSFHRQLLYANFKMIIKGFPKLLLSCVIFAFIIASLSMLLVIVTDNSHRMKIAIVYNNEKDSENSLLDMGSSYIQDYIPSDFIKMSPDEAVTKLSKDELTGIIYVEDMTALSDMKINGNIRVVFSDNGKMLNKQYRELIEAGLVDYKAISVATNSAQAISKNFDSTDKNALAMELLSIFMERNRQYERVVYASRDNVPLQVYYLGNAVTMFLFFIAISLVTTTCSYSKTFIKLLHREGVSNTGIIINRLIAVAFFMIVIGELIINSGALMMGRGIGAYSVLAVAIAMFLVSVFVVIIDSLIGRGESKLLLSGIVVFIIMLFSGNVVPLSTFSLWGESVGDKFITRWICGLISQTLYNRCSISMMLIGLVCGIVGLLVVIVAGFLRKRV